MRHAALAGLAMAMALSGCSHKPLPSEDVRPVQTMVAGRVPAALGATYSGAIAARNQSDQAFRVAGTVVKRLVDVGQHVVANQPLIQLDPANLDLNQQALPRLECESRLAVVPGATHLFEEPGALGQVADLASGWFARHFAPARTIAPAA